MRAGRRLCPIASIVALEMPRASASPTCIAHSNGCDHARAVIRIASSVSLSPSALR